MDNIYSGLVSAEAELLYDVLGCTRCDLFKTCGGGITAGPDFLAEGLMIVGEAPGEQEDLDGEPFVGRSGKLLTESLGKSGINREDVYITNIVKCRPPNNRDPLPSEVAACHDYLVRQVKIIKPKLIIALGRIAASHLLERQVKITKEHGMIDVLPFDEDVLVSIIYHPSYVLRNRNTKIEEDFLHDLEDARDIAYGRTTATEVHEGSVR